MKIKIDLGEYGHKILVVRPDEEHTTKDFRGFYKESIIFDAEVLRETPYEQPKLKILGSMELYQSELFEEENPIKD
jgi:hypothetical protein